MANQADKRNNEDTVAKIRKRVALEEKAHRIVVELSETTPSESSLKTLLQSITSEHYADIVEERSVCKLCAYPLCSKQVINVLKQKYWISTKTKTVYDITERKKFCSNYCMAASQHLHRQILSSPVWLRDNAPPITINFLPRTSAGLELPGQPVVNLPHRDLARQVQELERLDAMKISGTNVGGEDKKTTSDAVSSDDQPLRESPLPPEFRAVSDEFSQDSPLPEWQSDFDRENNPVAVCRRRSPSRRKSDEDSNTLEHRIKNVMKSMEKKKHKAPLKTCLIDIPSRNVDDSSGELSRAKATHVSGGHAVVDHLGCRDGAKREPTWLRLKGVLLEWRTRETVQLLTSYEVAGRHDGVWLVNSSQMSLTSDESQRNNVKTWQRREARGGGQTSSKEALEKEQETEEYDSKVRGFYGETQQAGGQKDDFEVVLPPVHSCSQMALRRKIVLDKLSRVLPEIINRTSLAMSCVSKCVREIVHTFNLTSHNILLQHDDWKAVGLILLKVLSLKDDLLRDQLANDALKEIIAGILSKVQLTADLVDEIVVLMTSSITDDEDVGKELARQNTPRITESEGQNSDNIDVLD